MFIIITETILILTALALFITQITRSSFKYSWLLAAGGATGAFLSVILWRLRFPQTLTLPTWQPQNIGIFTLSWLGDDISWFFAISLCALSSAVIWTSVVRMENDPKSWAGTLLMTACGILAVAAKNILTLIFLWTAIDIYETVVLLRLAENERENLNIITAFALRVLGTGLVLWPFLINAAQGLSSDFQNFPTSSIVYLILAAGLRLGTFPLQLSHQKENKIQRGFGTVLRSVSAAAVCILLARITSFTSITFFSAILIVIAAITGIYSGWMWFRSSDELLGRPFWILGMASLSFADCLLGNPEGSLRWGVILILCGGLLILFSARKRSVLWIPIIGLWGLSSLPFSLSSSVWQFGTLAHTLLLFLLIPAQILFTTGYLRHALHPGETSLESQEKWVKVIYPVGLLFIGLTILFLGLTPVSGARAADSWWLGLIILVLNSGLFIFSLKHSIKLPVSIPESWLHYFQTSKLSSALGKMYEFIGRITTIITSTMEGDGGLLWSFLILVLIISILSTQGIQ
jgi:hypothetical protein